MPEYTKDEQMAHEEFMKEMGEPKQITGLKIATNDDLAEFIKELNNGSTKRK